MIRTIVTPNNNFLSFSIPDTYIGKKVEIIAFSIDEPSENETAPVLNKKRFSAVKLKTKGYKFDREAL